MLAHAEGERRGGSCPHLPLIWRRCSKLVYIKSVRNTITPFMVVKISAAFREKGKHNTDRTEKAPRLDARAKRRWAILSEEVDTAERAVVLKGEGNERSERSALWL